MFFDLLLSFPSTPGLGRRKEPGKECVLFIYLFMSRFSSWTAEASRQSLPRAGRRADLVAGRCAVQGSCLPTFLLGSFRKACQMGMTSRQLNTYQFALARLEQKEWPSQGKAALCCNLSKYQPLTMVWLQSGIMERVETGQRWTKEKTKKKKVKNI